MGLNIEKILEASEQALAKASQMEDFSLKFEDLHADMKNMRDGHSLRMKILLKMEQEQKALSKHLDTIMNLQQGRMTMEMHAMLCVPQEGLLVDLSMEEEKRSQISSVEDPVSLSVHPDLVDIIFTCPEMPKEDLLIDLTEEDEPEDHQSGPGYVSVPSSVHPDLLDILFVSADELGHGEIKSDLNIGDIPVYEKKADSDVVDIRLKLDSLADGNEGNTGCIISNAATRTYADSENHFSTVNDDIAGETLASANLTHLISLCLLYSPYFVVPPVPNILGYDRMLFEMLHGNYWLRFLIATCALAQIFCSTFWEYIWLVPASVCGWWSIETVF